MTKFLSCVWFTVSAAAQLKEPSALVETYRNLPLSFEANRGQTDPRVLYLSRGVGVTLFLTAEEVVADINPARVSGGVVRIRLMGADLATPLEGLDRLPGMTNYYAGSDPSRWRQDIPSYRRLIRRNVYPGIDLTYYGNQKRLEYDFMVAAGADPRRIRIAFNGARRLRIDSDGNLVAETDAGELIHRRPEVRQNKRAIAGRYILRSRNEAGFELGAYDPTRPLVIDPVMDYAGFVGGSGEDQATSVVSDTQGAYIAGYTNSADFPAPAGRRIAGGFDAFITRVGTNGQVSFTTYLGGSGDDRINALAVIARVSVTGETNSQNFPTLAGVSGQRPVQAAYGGGASDAFAAQLDTRNGSLIYSTYLGGSGDDRGSGIALDSSSRAVVTGDTTSSDFPTRNPVQASLAGGSDAFVVQIAPGGDAILYSTYLGGKGDDKGRAIAINYFGEAYVTGETTSDDFPVSSPFQARPGGGSDAFLTKLSRDGSSLAFSTYLGGSGDDRATGIGLDSDLRIYVAGTTGSGNFPTANALQKSFGGGASDAFLTRFAPDGSSLVYSTYIGGSGDDEALALAVSSYGDGYVAGSTTSPDFPTKDPLQAAFGGGDGDAFLALMDSDGSMIHSTYFGGRSADRALGISIDTYGSAWIVGRTDSTDLPVKRGSPEFAGGPTDAFAAKISTPLITAMNLVVGKDLEVEVPVYLGVPAPPGGVQVTVTSSDPAKLLLSLSPTEMGKDSIVLTLQAGAQVLPRFYVQALEAAGNLKYTLSAPDYISRSGTVTLGPPGLIAFGQAGPSSFSGTSFTTTPLSPNPSIEVRLVSLDPATSQPRGFPRIRGGVPEISVDLTSSDPQVGTITKSPLVLRGGDEVARTEFHPVSLGRTTLTLRAPAGFTVLSELTATVIAPAVMLRNLSVGKDLQAEVPITLTAPAPQEGLDVTVTSDDPERLLLSPEPNQPGGSSVTVSVAPRAQDAKFYAQSVASAGEAHLTASSPGFTRGTSTVTLSPSGFYLSPDNDLTTTLLSGETTLLVVPAQLDPQSLSVRASQSLRAGVPPVRVEVNNSDPKVGSITVSPLVFNGGDRSQRTGFRPLGVGTTELTVGVPAGFSAPAARRQSKVTVVQPAVTLRNLTVGKDLQVQGGFTLTAPAPAGGLSVTITSADPARALLSASATATGAAQVTMSVSAGSTSSSPGFYVQGLASSGVVQLTASAEGFTPGTASVTLWPSGFVTATPEIRTTLFASSSEFRFGPSMLDPVTGLPQTSFQTIRAGLARVSVEITTSAPNVVTLVNLPVSFGPGDQSQSAAFRPVGLGSAVLTIAAPPGFATPARGHEIRVNVTTPALSLPNLTVGKDLQTQTGVSLQVSPPPEHVITVASAEPDKVLLSLEPNSTGAARVTLRRQGLGFPQFYVQALTGAGNVQLTASAPDFSDASGTVVLTPSGFAFSELPMPTRDGVFPTTTLSPNTRLVISSTQLDRFTGKADFSQSIRGGLSGIPVSVTSSNPAAGTITSSPLTFNGGESSKETLFHPVAPGTTLLTIGAPSGFSTPADRREISVRVTPPGLVLENMTVGKDLQRMAAVSLASGVSVPSGGLTVTVTSTDPEKVLLGRSPGVEGSASIVLPMAANFGRTQDFYVQGLAAQGTVLLNMSAEGFADSSSTVRLAPSGFVFLGSYSSEGLRTTTFSGNTSITVNSVVIDGYAQPVRGGREVTVELSSSDSGVGTIIGSPLTFHGGEFGRSFEFHPISPGNTVLTMAVPDGFVAPPAPQQQIRVTVTAPRLSLSFEFLTDTLTASTVGKDLQSRASVSAESLAREPREITVTSSDAARVLLAREPAATGAATITLLLGPGPPPQFYIHALSDRGTATLTVSGLGYSSGSSRVSTVPSGFVVSGPFGYSGFLTTSLSPSTALQITPGLLDPSTLAFQRAQPLRGGLSGVRVEVTSSDERVGAITTSPVIFNGGEGSKRTDFRPVAVGTAVITVATSAGFSTPSTGRQLLATVNTPGISFTTRPVGKNLQAGATVRLTTPAPSGGVVVTITSGDQSRLLVSTGQRTEGSERITVTVPAGQSDRSFYVHALAGSGSVQLTGSALRFNNGSADVALYPSGFAFDYPSNFGATIGSNYTLSVASFILDPQSLNPGERMEVRAGLNGISVEIASSDPSVGTIMPSPVIFNGSEGQRTTQFRPRSAGSTVLTVSAPQGFTEPATGRQITATVR